MTSAEFAGLVRRAEPLAERKPGAYRLRLAMLALAEELAEALPVPQDVMVIVMTGDNKRLAKFVKRVEGARIR